MTPGHPTPDLPTPTPADVLRWCAAAAPNLWFPAQQPGVARDSLDDPLWLLRQAGLVQVGDWVRGLGQGFSLTPAGQKALADPNAPIVVAPRPDPVPVDDIPPEDADLAHVPDPVPVPPPARGLTAYDRGELTREAFLAPRPTVIMPVLLVANIGWFLVGLLVAVQTGVSTDHYFQGVEDASKVLVKIGAAFGPDLLHGEWWRLATAGFVHVGLIHLLANLFSLYMIGPVAEDLWGRWRFAGLYLISGLAGTCAAMAISPMAGVAGASGSIWGVTLAVIVWLWRYRQHLPEEMVGVWLRRMGLMVMINVGISFLPGISWQAHFGGGLAGFLCAIFLDLTRPGASRRQLAIGLGGLVLIVAAMAGGLAAAVATTQPWTTARTAVSARDQAERQKVAAVLNAVNPVRLEVLHKSAIFTLKARTPDGLRRSREEVAALKADLAKASQADGFLADPEGFRAYVTEANGFADLLGRLVESGKVPSKDDWQALTSHRAKAAEAWKHVGGK